MKAKITVRDIDGTIWEKEGDIGMGCVADVTDGSWSNTEIDFSSVKPNDLIYFLATALTIASRLDPLLAEGAIRLYRVGGHTYE